MDKAVIEYKLLPTYTILFETKDGVCGRLEGTLRDVYLLAMQDYDDMYASGEMGSTVILKDDEAVAFGYLAVNQYLDDELSEMMKRAQQQ